MATRKLTLEERFWAKVDRSGGPDACWPWTGCRDKDGYGKFSRRHLRTHRFSFTVANGPIPDGLCVCHHCDNPPCCNPAHLFHGTNKDNTQDAARKGRIVSGARHWSRIRPEAVGRGERNGRARLTERLVRSLRSRYAAGESIAILSAESGLSISTVGPAVRGESWKHLSGTASRPPRHRPLADRFWVSVEKRGEDECWPWTGRCNRNGYGVVRRTPGGQETFTARVALELAQGTPLPRYAKVRSSCRNRRCCNRAHLATANRFTPDSVRQIRLLKAAGMRPSEIATKVGATRAAVSEILHRKTWAWLE